MAKTRLKLVSPATVKRTVTPTRRPNSELRPREHLTQREVEELIQAAKGNRWGQRDLTILLVAFRHGLRASDTCGLQWSDVEFVSGTLHLRRAKGGATSTHPLLGDELRALRALKRDAKSPFIFVSERGAPFTVSGLQKMIERAGIEAKTFAVQAGDTVSIAVGYRLFLRSWEGGVVLVDASTVANAGLNVPSVWVRLDCGGGVAASEPQQDLRVERR